MSPNQNRRPPVPPFTEETAIRKVRMAEVGTQLLVIGGRQDLPGFQKEHLRRTVGAWFPNAEFTFITDSGHFPMDETPVYLASLIERFLNAHRSLNQNRQASQHPCSEPVACIE